MTNEEFSGLLVLWPNINCQAFNLIHMIESLWNISRADKYGNSSAVKWYSFEWPIRLHSVLSAAANVSCNNFSLE